LPFSRGHAPAWAIMARHGKRINVRMSRRSMVTSALTLVKKGKATVKAAKNLPPCLRVIG
jgi:hypothetical protein